MQTFISRNFSKKAKVNIISMQCLLYTPLIGKNSEVLHPQDTPQNTLSHSNYPNNTRPTSTEENIKRKTRTPPNCPGQAIQDKFEKLPQMPSE